MKSSESSSCSVGLDFTVDNEGIVIISSVEPDGVASSAGLVEGDRVFSIDFTPVQGEASLQEIQSILVGPEGTDIILEVRSRQRRRSVSDPTTSDQSNSTGEEVVFAQRVSMQPPLICDGVSASDSESVVDCSPTQDAVSVDRHFVTLVRMKSPHCGRPVCQ